MEGQKIQFDWDECQARAYMVEIVTQMVNEGATKREIIDRILFGDWGADTMNIFEEGQPFCIECGRPNSRFINDCDCKKEAV